MGVLVGGRTIVGRARQAAINVGELTLLFRAALRGAVRRPFYWAKTEHGLARSSRRAMMRRAEPRN